MTWGIVPDVNKFKVNYAAIEYHELPSLIFTFISEKTERFYTGKWLS